MLDCESKALGFLHTFSETENTHDSFCENLGNDSDCPLHASEDCKNQYNAASAHYTAFFETITDGVIEAQQTEKEDGAPGHFSNNVKKKLEDTYGTPLVLDQAEPVPRPRRPPDVI
ncbi:hypothetical protein AVEN_270507-1 [Araneus ventricosus]|uniref:Uncharacterized protein n=1 Tax=Araneus ventricosus TaxID=182803 RepID=A0A4Y2B7F5_ARAVE|nr:hypothetical protein AVEN_270507-1 [Araneus ventricosus]